MSPLILSITMYVRPERVNAHKTLGTGIDVCCDTKRIIDASDKCTRRLYLIHSSPDNIRTFPSQGRIRLRNLIARSVKPRFRKLSLTGLDALNGAVDDEGGPFRLGDIMSID